MSNPRFVRKFQEQLDHIHASADAYDAGRESESLRLAVSMRVLFHQTAASRSVIHHLRMHDVQMLSSALPPLRWQSFVDAEISLMSLSGGVRHIPKLGNQYHRCTLSEWWDGQKIVGFSGAEFSRRKLILTAANQDGGAHVDEELASFYEDLEEGLGSFTVNLHNLEYAGTCKHPDNNRAAQNLHLALIRQFAAEVIAAATHFRWIAGLNKETR